MGERITGGSMGEQHQRSTGEVVLDGAKRMVALGQAIEKLEQSVAQVVAVTIGDHWDDRDPLTYNPVSVPVSRPKLLGLLKEEQEHVGTQLARILGQLYAQR